MFRAVPSSQVMNSHLPSLSSSASGGYLLSTPLASTLPFCFLYESNPGGLKKYPRSGERPLLVLFFCLVSL